MNLICIVTHVYDLLFTCTTLSRAANEVCQCLCLFKQLYVVIITSSQRFGCKFYLLRKRYTFEIMALLVQPQTRSYFLKLVTVKVNTIGSMQIMPSSESITLWVRYNSIYRLDSF